MLLFSERTWKHHAVTICVPVAVLAYVWAKGMFSRRAIIALQVSMVAVILLTLVPSVGGKFQDDCLAYGSHTAIFLILFVWMCVVLSQRSALKPREGV
jgi:CDP-diglyceride synthetase